MNSKRKILVVEDEPDFRRALRIRLESNGFEVMEAEDGAEGLDMARNRGPDLVILDIMLPKMDGFRVALLLKSDDRYKAIPIVMLTVLDQEGDRDVGIEAGACAYITKPYKPPELIHAIEECLLRRSTRMGSGLN